MKTRESIQAGLWSERCGIYRMQARREALGGGGDTWYWLGHAMHAEQQRQRLYREMVRENNSALWGVSPFRLAFPVLALLRRLSPRSFMERTDVLMSVTTQDGSDRS